MQLEFIGEKRHFEVGYKEKLKHFPKLEARKLRIDFDSRGDQITNKTIKTAPGTDQASPSC